MRSLLQRKINEYYIVWVCVCSLRYPACNAHGPYFHLWPVWLYSIFPHYLIKGKIFAKKIIEPEVRVLISFAVLSETFLILRRTERVMIKTVCCSSCKVFITLVIFNKLHFSRKIVEKLSNIKFNENSSCGSPADGQTVRHTWRS